VYDPIGCGVVQLLEVSMSETLKPCPWCKKEPIRMVGRDGWVCCPKCGVAKPIEVWNKRTPDWQELAREMATAIAKLRAANASTVMDPRYTYVRSSRVLMDAYVDLAGVESKARKAGLLEER
jgi:uncharacterized Zn finger protein (UPF0148 family)